MSVADEPTAKPVQAGQQGAGTAAGAEVGAGAEAQAEAGKQAGTDAGEQDEAGTGADAGEQDGGGERAPQLSLKEQARLLAEQRSRSARRQALAGAAGALVVVVAAVLALVHFTGDDGSSSAVPEATAATERAGAPEGERGGSPAAESGATAPAPVPAAAAVVRAVTGVPAAVLDRVGKGQTSAAPVPVSGIPALVDGGKPVVLYVGAEYCPFCASQRWAVVVALSRFGTFSNLGATHSASDDAYPDTQTLTFHGAGYTSPYLVFQGVETATNVRQGNGYGPLQELTPEQMQIMGTLDAPPYVPENSAGAIPFMDFGNRYLLVGGTYDVELLQGKSAEQIADALDDPNDPIARGVDGTANMMTAVICRLTGGKPGKVCGSAAVRAYAKGF